jgi:murein DD-endopeptidase MepM/ murein hydrolase activator NlpD
MQMIPIQHMRRRSLSLAICGLLALGACDQPLDFDLRGLSGGFSTSNAAQNVPADRPDPDSRGVISYPSYQVAVAQLGDTLQDLADRVGLPVDDLARYNGLEPEIKLRRGEVIALPRRVAEPSPESGEIAAVPIQTGRVDVSTLAGNAINTSDPTPAIEPTKKPLLPETGQEPIRHQVERGETAFTIARLYRVPVKSLAEWNGLGTDFALREGQFLLIPIARVAAPAQSTAPDIATLPGSGTPTPTPPSATKPLPPDDTANPSNPPSTDVPAVDVGTPTQEPAATQMSMPVEGSIIRDYNKGKNEGIDIKAAPGSPVKAAIAGTIAAITKSAEGIPIIVIRHPKNILTVYANVDQVQVAKGDTVNRDQSIARLRADESDAYVHFEVRDGFDSVNPALYLD